MRAYMLQVPESLLEERRRSGADRFDEMWNGVLHMVPFPSSEHQRIGAELIAALLPLAKARGLRAFYETAIHRPGTEKDYRGPDNVFARPEHVSARGVEGRAELAIEIMSPDDETYEKIPFYQDVGVQELLVVDPVQKTVQLFVLRGGKLLPVVSDDSGAVRSAALGVTFTTVPGPALQLRWPDGSVTIS